jgi:hypothetical protein
VRQVDKDLNAFGDDLVRRLAIDVHDEADTARIMFILRVVQPLRRW